MIRRSSLFLVTAAGVLWLSGCATSRGVNEAGFVHYQTGIASYYAHDFHGRTTANGERFDMYAMTAAHLSLPFGTLVRVTNLRNGRQVILRVNDRGPYVTGRVLDVSYGAARELDMLRDGVVRVRIDLIDPEADTATATGTHGW